MSRGLAPRFVALDNEPELWGMTHYDVHPECTTYEEILATYLEYAPVLREAAPDSELMGPVMCCWYSFWGTAPGPREGEYRDFLPWFLEQVREHDRRFGTRTLDVVDVHFYPQSDVYNDRTDPETSARRLRSTRALYDEDYIDESWIAESIALIPRLRATIDESYPGTPLAITEWNFGADTSMNGALAIADVLGIFGREGVYASAYWRSPPIGSPGYFAFKMHGNYDDRGTAFEGAAVAVDAPEPDVVSSFVALNTTTNRLQVMLLNKDPDETQSVQIEMRGYLPRTSAMMYQYSSDTPGEIADREIGVSKSGFEVELLPYSITVVALDPA